MRYKNDLSPEEYENKNRSLHGKIEKGEPLTLEEEAFVCHCLKYENLLNHPFCLDEYFTRTFLARTTNVPKEMYSLKERDNIYYVGLVNEWSKTINKTNHTDPLLQITAVETREELRHLRKGFSIFRDSYRDYNIRKFRLLEWSKYRYIMIKDIFNLIIKSDEYKLSLNGKEIIFNYFSLTHILTRHFGHVMKTYESDKSHFIKDVHHEEIHLKIEDIFRQIDASNFYINDSIEEVNIRLNGTLYKIYTTNESKHVPGTKDPVPYQRLSTMFPIKHPKMLKRLDEEYEEKVITDTLSVFVKKVPA